ncbi:hypothetical protein OOJ91_12500 [Micromonospora lupini]|uniref:hypothetical protein n=1 Tax=Micromonospora lupini TaxID=285679 RepID=UPI0022599659|nr:hypothetical protein [Micromonospora lupini]MCX5066700.1 hypothetical protein [Micromonospora lupini]
MTTFAPTDVTVIRAYAVTGADLVPAKYRSVRILPDKVTVTFLNGTPTRLVIEGPNAKKDGTAGVNRHEESWSLDWAGDAATAPEWVAPLLDASDVRLEVEDQATELNAVREFVGRYPALTPDLRAKLDAGHHDPEMAVVEGIRDILRRQAAAVRHD